MKSSLRLAGAAALCAALLLSACAKKSTDQTTTSTDSTQSTAATTAPDASATMSATVATTVPAAQSTTSTASTSNGAASGGYVDLPVYPGATELKDQSMSVSANEGTLVVKAYATKDDTKNVADWYKSHLPASFKGGFVTAGDKSIGTFVDEHTDGDQSVVVASQPDGTTRIQLTTKHGK